MVGESNKEQDALRWEIDTAAISIPPPFNNGLLQYSRFQQKPSTAIPSTANTNELPARWEDENVYSFMGGDSYTVGLGSSTSEKGVRFPVSSPTHASDQLSQTPLQRTHSR